VTGKNAGLEVSSDQLKNELVEIKDRLSALETIASLANRKEVEAFVVENLKTDHAKKIMKFCEQPQTREELIAEFKFNNTPALDYHLKPLREGDLLQLHINGDGKQTFEQSNLFRRLPKQTIRRILGS
jgi:hypothetical protein